MSYKLNKMAVCLAMGTALGLSGAAWGQDADADNPNVTVQDRERPDYDPLGIRAGSFLVFPELGIEGGYDTNVYASNDDEQDDFFATVRPAVEARSDWSRHALNVGFGAEAAQYAQEDDNNYEDFYFDTTGRLDITRADSLSGALEFDRLHEDRESPEDEGEGTEITSFYQPVARLTYRHNFARFYTQVGADLTRFDYEDSGDVNEDDRDRNQYRGLLRVGYEISPRIETFVLGTYDIRRYDETPNDQGINRDSEGYTGRAGLGVDFTGILFGEASVGYTQRDYEDDDSVGGLSGSAGLTWNVTQLTSILLNAESEIRETTVTFEDDEATARLDSRIGLDVTHELLRNVLLNANTSYTRSDFEGTSRVDDTYEVGGGVTYLLNRNLSLEATYRYSNRQSDESDSEFARNIVLLGVTARL